MSNVVKDNFIFNELDLTPIYQKLVDQYKWAPLDATRAIQYYRNFLFLKKKYSDGKYQLPPTADVDEVWHTHILYTAKYQQDCQNIFGYFLHHTPQIISSNDTAAKEAAEYDFEIMQQLHLNEFGCYVPKVRVTFIVLMKEFIIFGFRKVFARNKKVNKPVAA